MEDWIAIEGRSHLELVTAARLCWLLDGGTNDCFLGQVPLWNSGKKEGVVGVPAVEGLHNSCLALRVKENSCRMGSDYARCK